MHKLTECRMIQAVWTGDIASYYRIWI